MNPLNIYDYLEIHVMNSWALKHFLELEAPIMLKYLGGKYILYIAQDPATFMC